VQRGPYAYCRGRRGASDLSQQEEKKKREQRNRNCEKKRGQDVCVSPSQRKERLVALSGEETSKRGKKAPSPRRGGRKNSMSKEREDGECGDTSPAKQGKFLSQRKKRREPFGREREGRSLKEKEEEKAHEIKRKHQVGRKTPAILEGPGRGTIGPPQKDTGIKTSEGIHLGREGPCAKREGSLVGKGEVNGGTFCLRQLLHPRGGKELAFNQMRNGSFPSGKKKPLLEGCWVYSQQSSREASSKEGSRGFTYKEGKRGLAQKARRYAI